MMGAKVKNLSRVKSSLSRVESTCVESRTSKGKKLLLTHSVVLLLRSFVMPTMRQRPAPAVAAAAASLPTQPPAAAAADAAGATHAASQSNTEDTKKRKRGPPSADAAAAESKSKAAAVAARGIESKANTNAVDWRVRRIVQDLARLDERRRGGGDADVIALSDDDDDDEEETAIDMLVREMMAEARRAVAERRTLAAAAAAAPAAGMDTRMDRDDEEIGPVVEEYELSICCECLQVEDPTSDIPILLCDGCDAACHLSCAKDRPKLSKVPEGDWYCSMCAKKVDAKTSSIAEDPDAQKPARIGKGDTKAKKKALEADFDNATSKRDLPRGVYKQSFGPSFTAQANWGGKTRFIGTFATPEQASAAYMSVKEDLARVKVSASDAEEVDTAFDEAKTKALETFGGFVRKKKKKKNKSYGFDSIRSHCKDKKRKGEYLFRVKWNNGHTTMEPDTYLKEDDPTTFITYLRSSGLAKTKKYAWANEEEYV